MEKLLNFSGHPVMGSEFAPLIGVNFDLTDPEGIVSVLDAAIAAAPEIEAIESGRLVTVVLPGMAPVAALFLARWQGRFGSFPRIAWAVRTAGGFVFTDESSADLQSLRTEARTLRG